MTTEQTATLTAVFQAISAYDTDALRGLVTPESELIQPERPAYAGPDGAERLINDLARSFTEFSIRPNRTLGDGDGAAVEWTATITDFGGGQSRVDGCSVVDFQGPLVRRLRTYFRPEDAHS